MLSVEGWAEIRRLHRSERMPIRVIARTVGCSKNTVKKALCDEAPPQYERAPTGSIVDAVEPRIRELLRAWPTMPATVIAERVGWDRGLTVLKDRVRDLRPVYLPPDPASRTTLYYVIHTIAIFRPNNHLFWGSCCSGARTTSAQCFPSTSSCARSLPRSTASRTTVSG